MSGDLSILYVGLLILSLSVVNGIHRYKVSDKIISKIVLTIIFIIHLPLALFMGLGVMALFCCAPIFIFIHGLITLDVEEMFGGVAGLFIGIAWWWAFAYTGECID